MNADKRIPIIWKGNTRYFHKSHIHYDIIDVCILFPMN